MKIKTNAENRKEVVKAVAEILNTPSKYLGVPSCNFQVGNCIIDRAGTVETDDEKTAEIVLAGLIERGFVDVPETDESKLLVSFPMEGMTALNLKNLIFLIHSRQYLINQSVGEKNFSIPDGLVEELEGNGEVTAEAFEDSFRAYEEDIKGIKIADGNLTFRFPYTEDAVRAKAYTDLASAMVKQEKEQKRIGKGRADMSKNWEEKFKPEDLQRLRGFRLMDDDFMSKCFEENIECTELVLQIVLGRNDLKVEKVAIQHHLKNLQGRSIIRARREAGEPGRNLCNLYYRA